MSSFSQAEKFLALNLSRNLEEVEEDDIPDDRIELSNLTINVSDFPFSVPSTAKLDIENTISEKHTISINILGNAEILKTSTITLDANEKIEDKELLFLFNRAGNINIRIKAAEDELTETIRIS